MFSSLILSFYLSLLLRFLIVAWFPNLFLSKREVKVIPFSKFIPSIDMFISDFLTERGTSDPGGKLWGRGLA